MATYKLIQIIINDHFNSLFLFTWLFAFAILFGGVCTISPTPYSSIFYTVLFIKTLGYVFCLLGSMYYLSWHATGVSRDTEIELQSIEKHVTLLKAWRKRTLDHPKFAEIEHHVQQKRLVKSISQSRRHIDFYQNAGEIEKGAYKLVIDESIDALEAHVQVLESDLNQLCLFYYILIRAIIPINIIINFKYGFV